VLYNCVPGTKTPGGETFRKVATPQGVILEAGLRDFLKAAFAGKSDVEFQTAVTAMMERASMLSAAKVATPPQAPPPPGCDSWAQRLMGVFDVDGNGVLDKPEFLALYDCVPDRDAGGGNLAFSRADPKGSGGVTVEGLTGFLASSFAGKTNEVFIAAVMQMMERASIACAAKIAQREAADSFLESISPTPVPPTPEPSSPPSFLARKIAQNAPSQQPPVALPPSLPSVDPALLERMDGVLPKLFERYDADCSGTLNTPQELQQLTINLTFNLGLRIRPDKLQALVATVAQPISWNPDQFRSWYVGNVLVLP